MACAQPQHHPLPPPATATATAVVLDDEPSIETDKLSYEIFSILETKFLFGYDPDPRLWLPPKPPAGAVGDLESTDPSIKSQRGKVCVLCIDGGGMRGILSGKALAYLERALRMKSGDPDARVSDYFDVAAGTGVGGIFAAMLFATRDGRRPIFAAEDTWRMLADQGGKFFGKGGGGGGGGRGFFRRILRGGGIAAATSGLERVVREAFARGDGEKSGDLTLKDTLKPVLITCYDMNSSAPFLFSRADALETDSFDFNLWEVCRATSSEPGVFEPVEVKSVDGRTQCMAVDGGLVMSNPAVAAITHVLHNKHEFPFVRGVEDLLVLSLGTGQLLEVSHDYQRVKGWRAKDWAHPMTRISAESSADLMDHSIAMAFSHCNSNNYVRIQANGSSLGRCGPNIDTDASPDNVKKLVGIAEEMLKQKNVESVLFGGKKISEETNSEKLDWIAGVLVQEHQRRSCRIAPTVAFKQARPKPTANK
ncbi:hypothetical protein MLD38_002573 [Melastoma candidum]|uniref:Uncharacterized protein n=1 Tax=Melastoma candidum TaxID=119954 RepID=A0ACB9S3I4_9MYRT|nr:hypothetical protein MLD38_002573 [Melastoma candidum]